MRSNPIASPYATRALITHAGATRRLTRALGAGVLAGSLLAAGPASAIDWANSNVDSYYDIGGNWVGGVAPGPGDVAAFNSVTNVTVRWDGLTGNTTTSSLNVTNSTVLFVSSSSQSHSTTGNALVTGPSAQFYTDGLVASPFVLNVGNRLDVVDGALFVNRNGSTVNAAGLWVGTSSSANLSQAWIEGPATLAVSGTTELGLNGAEGTLEFRLGTTGNTLGTVNIANSGFTNSTGILNVTGGSQVTTGSIEAGDQGLAGQAGTILVEDASSSITQTGASTFTLGAASNSTGLLTVSNGGVFDTGTGTTTVNATGTVNVITGGTFRTDGNLLINGGSVAIDSTSSFDPNGDITVDGGLLDMDNINSFFMANNRTLLATNGGQVQADDTLWVFGGQTVTVNAGADMTHNGFMGIGTGNGNGTLNIDGAGSTFVKTGGLRLVENGATGTINITNSGSATLSGALNIVNVATTATNNGTVNVNTGGDLTAATINIGNGDGNQGTGTINLDGAGSTLTQTGASAINLGNVDTPGNAGVHTINVTNSAVFNTGTGTTTVNATGTLDINTSGVFNANGNIVVDGGTLNRTGSTALNLAANRTLTASNNGQVNFTNNYDLDDDTTFIFNSGADFIGTSFFDIGNASDGTLVVDGAGTTFSFVSGSWWGNGGATSSVTVSNDAVLTAGGLTQVVQSGANTTSTVSIESGGDINLDTLWIGQNNAAGSAGTFTVTGAGSTATQSGASPLIVGSSTDGTGTLNLDAGGVFTTGTGTTTVNATGTLDINTGGTFNANGDVNVDGGTLNRDGYTALNLAANRTLTASNNGQVNFTGSYDLDDDTTFIFNSGADFNSTGYFDIGNVSDGTLIVDGAGTTFSIGASSYWGTGGATSTVTVSNDAVLTAGGTTQVVQSGANTTSTVSIESGGDINLDTLWIGQNNAVGSAGTFTVTGAGSTATQSGASVLIVGSSTDGTGTLNVTDSGVFNTGTGLTTINATGTLNINTGGVFNANGDFTREVGGTVNHTGGTLAVNGGVFNPNQTDYTIDGAAPADLPTLILTNGATAPGVTGVMVVGSTNRGRLEILNGATLNSSDPDLGSLVGSEGQALVDGVGSVWDNNGFGDIAVGEGGKGELVVSNGGSVLSGDDIVLGRQGTATGTGLVTTGGSLNANSGIYVGEAGSGYLEIGPNASATSSFMNIGLSALNTGTVEINGAGATVDVNGTIFMGSTGATLNLSDGTLTANTIQNTAGGAFNMTGGTLVVNNFNGTLDQQGGTVAPGSSPGITNVSGDYNILGGTLAIEIDGDTPGIGHDRVNVTGAANLGGELDLSIGFVPTPYDTFTILTSLTLNNTTFDTIAGNYYAPGRILAVTYTATDVVIIDALRGDLDLDGDIDGVDISAMFVNFNGPGGGVPGNPLADLDGDGDVDGVDISQAFVAFTGPLAPATVPEPTSLALLGLGGLIVSRRRKRSA